ncbi:alcohol dehydrogenase catalytic domain-containing protein [Streptomyces sp. NPDC058625]|uniref:(R)-mandelonitrile lyase n=1 Tax=Streptomyces sp. NPDC058625 TaxID=3346564 RepID=UPI00364CC2F6
MRGAVVHVPGDVRFETVEDPKILHPTDAVIRTAVTCVCGSDLWPYRGAEPIGDPHPMGHEYVGFVEEAGSEVTSLRPGRFVVGSFATSDNTCASCKNGFLSNCLHREFMSTCQAEYVRIPNAQGTLVATDEVPGEEFWPGLPAVSDVMGTGWWAADAAEPSRPSSSPDPPTAQGAIMQITRSSIDTVKGPADWFTGDVYIDAVAAASAPSRVTASLVHFMPGARTHWHRHPLGQTVFVTEGVGLCQRRGGPVEVIRPGDRVLFEADEEHWHGAAPNRLMVHLAVNEGDDDHAVVHWLNPVTDEEYHAAPATG